MSRAIYGCNKQCRSLSFVRGWVGGVSNILERDAAFHWKPLQHCELGRATVDRASSESLHPELMRFALSCLSSTVAGNSLRRV